MGVFFVSPFTLKGLLDGSAPPLLLDVRKAEALAQSGLAIPGAHWLDPALVCEWGHQLPRCRLIIVYCVHGHEVSQGVCAALRARGHDARVLDGGFEGWRMADGAVVPAPISAAVQ